MKKSYKKKRGKQSIKVKNYPMPTDPKNGKNHSTHASCPGCDAVLPPHSQFCGICGTQLTKDQEWEPHAEDTDETAQVETVKFASVSRVHSQAEGSQRSPKDKGITATLIEEAEDEQSSNDDTSYEETAKVDASPTHGSAFPQSREKTWGWLPFISLISAVGIFTLALAYEAGRLSSNWSLILFWLSIILIFLPIAVRLFLFSPSRRESLALLVVLTIGFFSIQYLPYPIYFANYDEFLHVRSAQDIFMSGHLFHVNPILPVSSFYPGLQIATNALSSLTGLSLFASGVVLIGLTRLLGVFALYLFFEYLSKSSKLASLATLLYMINPNFIFFDQMFSYESLAISLAFFITFTVAYRYYVLIRRSVGLTLAIGLALGAVAITHHITSFALVAFLFLWTALFLFLRRVPAFRQKSAEKAVTSPWPWDIALLGLALVIAWLICTDGAVIGYLWPHITNTVQQITQLLAHKGAPRQLFQNPSGMVAPLWQRLLSYASVALILVGLLVGFFQIWRQHRTNAAILALAAGALAYPVTQALRLTPAGGEMGDRATEFVFVGIAFVLVIGATAFRILFIPGWMRKAVLFSALGIICFGQMALGSGHSWNYIPGPYLVSADSRSVEPEGITAARWANSYLGSGQRVASDRINTLLMMTYGDESVVTAGNSNLPISQVFTSLRLGSGVMTILQQDNIQYLVVDLRLSTSLPYVGTYFNLPASGGEPVTKPIDQAALTKFDGVKNLNRLFDSGNIVIYQVTTFVKGTTTSSTPPSCIPAPSTTGSATYPTVAPSYTGISSDIPATRNTTITLTGVQQKQGAICGSIAGMLAGSFNGTVTSNGKIQFVVTSSTGKPAVSFDGILLSDGNITGTYCRPRAGAGTCSDYGIWSVSPTR